MRKALLRAAAPAAAILLTACGGGGGGGLVSTPTPTPTPTPASSFPLTATGTFQTIHGDALYKINPSNGVGTMDRIGVAGRDPNFTVSYDPASGGYTVSNSTSSATFADASRTTSGFIDEYSKQSGSISDDLKVFGNVRPGGSQTGATVQLTYLSFASWTHADSTTGDRRTSYLLFGYPTTDMPRTGSATYSTSVTGTMVGPDSNGQNFAASSISGTATFSADFGVGTVATGLNLTRASNQSSLGTYNGTGTISADQFGGSFASTNPYFSSGTFQGGFFGPGATEMGYAFQIHNLNPDPYAGASINVVDQSIVGVVVGKKN